MSDTNSTPLNQKQDPLQLALKVLGLIACVYIFIVGIKTMGTSFKLFGSDLTKNILTATSNPMMALVIGIFATALVQSSSTTTSIIVGLVAAGALDIQGAIPMIMGANIGTTVTNTLVSLGHANNSAEYKRALSAATVHDFFNLMTVAILFPLELMTGFLARMAGAMQAAFTGVGGMKLANPLKTAIKPAVEFLKSITAESPTLLLIISIVLIIGMLISIVKLLRSMVLAKIQTFFDEHLFKTPGRAMFFGLLLTIGVQSSSITTSLVIPLAGAGVLRLIQIFPYTMGANVGTTMTAMLAALATGEAAAVTVAFAHLLFNLSGIALIWPFPKMRQIPITCAEWLAEQATHRWYVPVGFVGLVFFIIPLSMIMVFRGGTIEPVQTAKNADTEQVVETAPLDPANKNIGIITVKGSDTLVILAQKWAEVYMSSNPEVSVQVTGGGSGTGFAALQNKTTDIATASRAIKSKEEYECVKAFGETPVEHKVCLDGLTVYVHPDNQLAALTMDQLRQVFIGEVRNWKAFGGPDAPIQVYSRENSSGTYEFFKSRVLKERDFSPNSQYMPGTAAVVQAVAKDMNAIGYGGAAYGSTVKILKLKEDADSPALAPTQDNVIAGNYPLWRYLYAYVAPGQNRDELTSYLNWIRSDAGQKIVTEVGYFPLPEKDRRQLLSALQLQR